MTTPTRALHLTLFVSAGTTAARTARRRVEHLLASLSRDRVELSEVDVFSEPERAAAAGVLLTPCLICEYGADREVLIGDLADDARLRDTLANVGFPLAMDA